MSTVLKASVQKSPAVDRPDPKYIALAKRLKIKVATIPSDLMLRKILEEQSIGIYSLTAVAKYLIAKRPTDHRFVWVPAAQNQLTPRALHARYPHYKNGLSIHGYIATDHGIYNKPIPYPVLLTIEKIVKASKDTGLTPLFYVSDYAFADREPQRTQRYDPFLAVGTSDSDALYVIERWDEPGFREETYSSRSKTKTTKATK